MIEEQHTYNQTHDEENIQGKISRIRDTNKYRKQQSDLPIYFSTNKKAKYIISYRNRLMKIRIQI
jgi:hypothetical protein